MKSSSQYSKEWREKNPKKYRQLTKVQHLKERKILHNLKINGCAICGYNKCIECLEFHHVNSQEKCFSIVGQNMGRKIVDLINELNKCILLCPNCHKEIHYKRKETK